MTNGGATTPLQAWYAANPDDVPELERQMRRKVHYVVKPDHLWGNVVHLARTGSDRLLDTLQKGFRFIEEQSFESTFQGLFSEINLASDKLGRTYADRNRTLCAVIGEIDRGLTEFSTSADTLGDAYEYLISQFAAGSGKKAGEFYTPQQISSILSAIVTLDGQEPRTGPRERLERVFDFACGSGSLLLNVRHRVTEAGGTIGRIVGVEKNITTCNLARMNMLLHGVKDTDARSRTATPAAWGSRRSSTTTTTSTSRATSARPRRKRGSTSVRCTRSWCGSSGTSGRRRRGTTSS